MTASIILEGERISWVLLPFEKFLKTPLQLGMHSQMIFDLHDELLIFFFAENTLEILENTYASKSFSQMNAYDQLMKQDK